MKPEFILRFIPIVIGIGITLLSLRFLSDYIPVLFIIILFGLISSIFGLIRPSINFPQTQIQVRYLLLGIALPFIWEISANKFEYWITKRKGKAVVEKLKDYHSNHGHYSAHLNIITNDTINIEYTPDSLFQQYEFSIWLNDWTEYEYNFNQDKWSTMDWTD